MTPIGITDHARLRIQQRGIQEDMLPLLLKYGQKTYDNYGDQVYYLNKASRERLERECGREVLRKIRDTLDIYAVVGEGNGLVTVGHRFKRIKRH